MCRWAAIWSPRPTQCCASGALLHRFLSPARVPLVDDRPSASGRRRFAGVRPQAGAPFGGPSTPRRPSLGPGPAARGRAAHPARRTLHADAVVFACHSDQALAMLEDASDAERQVLARSPTHPTTCPAHRRVVLPRRPLAARRELSPAPRRGSRRALTYDMNVLQASGRAPLPGVAQPRRPDRRETGPAPVQLQPPVTPAGRRRAEAPRGDHGRNRSFYCGAYWRSGFTRMASSADSRSCRSSSGGQTVHSASTKVG